LIVNVAATLK